MSKSYKRGKKYLRVKHSAGEYRFDAPEVYDDGYVPGLKYEPLQSFKDFDYKGYETSKDRDKKLKKADNILGKAWKALKKAGSSKELQWVVGLIISALILFGNNRGGRGDDLMSALKDIQAGRVDFDTLNDAKNAIGDIIKAYKK